jgi:hypothetical protein
MILVGLRDVLGSLVSVCDVLDTLEGFGFFGDGKVASSSLPEELHDSAEELLDSTTGSSTSDSLFLFNVSFCSFAAASATA